jgi:hypothetical protein
MTARENYPRTCDTVFRQIDEKREMRESSRKTLGRRQQQEFGRLRKFAFLEAFAHLPCSKTPNSGIQNL